MALRRLNRGRCVLAAALLAVGLVAMPGRADADLIRGLGTIISGVFAVPEGIIAGTLNGPPIIGTIVGALAGTLNGVKMVTFGTLEVAGSAVPLALKLLPFLPLAL